MKYGLIGKTLSYSFSKIIHEKLGYPYELIELAENEVGKFLKEFKFDAINVTIPYKETVIKYLDEIDENAKEIGACNTIIKKDNKLYGYNTDFYASRMLIQRQGVNVSGKRALILGTGGTSKTYFHVLKSLGVTQITKVSRTPKGNQISYEEAIQKYNDFEILINTTPVGMSTNVDAMPIDIRKFNNLSLVVDAIYNPLNTELVIRARQKGVKAVGGLYMLVAQAVFASELFGKCKATEELMNSIYSDVYQSKRNIVFVGMPGVGKSTIAKALDENYLDTDLLITNTFKMTPKEIINTYGEKNFREKESQIIEQVSKENNKIIATGGGAILSEKNRINLKKNSLVVYLYAPIEELHSFDDRPLTNNKELLEKVFNERKDIYNNIADIIVDRKSTIEEIKKEITNYENTCN